MARIGKGELPACRLGNTDVELRAREGAGGWRGWKEGFLEEVGLEWGCGDWRGVGMVG